MSNWLWCWKNELNLNIDQSFDHQMSLSKSKCWYSNNCLHFLKCAVPFVTLASKNCNTVLEAPSLMHEIVRNTVQLGKKKNKARSNSNNFVHIIRIEIHIFNRVSRFLSGHNVIKLFISVTYKFSLKARLFVPGKPFQPNLMFVGKARGPVS